MEQTSKPAPLTAREFLKKTWKELRYAMYLTTHPAKGFWEIKNEGEGSTFTGLLIFGFTVFVMILSNLYTGFIFGGERNVHYNFFTTVVSTSALFFGWAIANWCLTCLFEGEGKITDIIRATGYALLPFAIIQLLMIFLSNYFVIREEQFYTMLNSISFAWMIALLIMSVMITHQYSVAKALLVCIASAVAMMMLAYLILLFFFLINRIMDFITIYMDEVRIRMVD